MCLLVRAVEAMGMSAFETASFAIISAEFPDHISSAFSFLETFLGIGYMVGATVGGFLYELGGFGLPFWVYGVLVLSAGILFFVWLPRPKEVCRGRESHVLTLLRSPLVWASMSLVTAGSLSLGFFNPTLTLHLKKYGLSTFESSLFFVIAPLLHGLLAPFWGYVSDSRLWVITVGYVLFGLGIGCTVIPTMKCCVIGARELGFPDNIITYGMVSGLSNANFHLGAFLGPTLAGALVEEIGFDYSATIVAAMFMTSLFIILGFFGFQLLRRGRGGSCKHSLAGNDR
ncbi:MFS-type transporter SLC18B1-like [Elysia marginata]|uniref:MFS-type transporter SLC18B1-like n=1 Tax=Elysia marginata TaxID=1093978 RepID=A0AAV4FR08_9GAST|nr:MFS-type transporter SLC18B1-like [Elysia marginata]